MTPSDTRLYSRIEVTQAINRVAGYLTDQFRDQVSVKDPLVFLVVLKGAIPFYVYLSERIELPNVAEFITVKSFDEYSARRMEDGPVIDIPVEVLANLAARHVVIIDDICDTGKTLALVKERVLQAHAKSVKVITLFYNNHVDEPGILLDYYALPTQGKFIYGFGLDSHRGVGRNLRDVFVLAGHNG